MALGRLDDAKRVLSEARHEQRFFFAQARASYLIALLENNEPVRQQILQEALSQPVATSAANWEPRTLAFRGRMRTAHDEFSPTTSPKWRPTTPRRKRSRTPWSASVTWRAPRSPRL
jgi:hypothetical protein